MLRLTWPRLGALAALVLALAAVPLATAEPRSAAADVTGAVGQPVTLDGEQVHTVLRAERWWGGGFWFVKKGEAAVTVHVRVQAIAKTSCNPLYYGVRVPSGATFGRAVLGSRDPVLESSAALQEGEVHEGWLTFVVPEKDVNGMTLVYRMHGGFGSTLAVPLGTPAPSPSARVGRSIALENEQVHTVVAASRWTGGGVFRPKTGSVYVTVNVRVKAVAPTTAGGTYYSLRDGAGSSYRGPVLGSRKPALVWKKTLAPGASATGWVTFMVPKSQARSLTLIYHMRGGAGPTLLVRLPAL